MQKNPNEKQLAEAIEFLAANNWSAAHVLVQELDDRLACRIHGLVHRIEGDLDNSRYWYDRSGSRLDEGRSVEEEINELRRDLEAGD